MTYIICIAFKIAIILIVLIIGIVIGMAIMAYSASKEIAQACDDAYLIGYAKGEEEERQRSDYY
ncbi:MAG: hypothetical protein IJ379_05140 [Lachnospiraceae bacterium]|nr:hypothetical protein [Lachnospiraceae bacterium]